MTIHNHTKWGSGTSPAIANESALTIATVGN